MDFKSQLKRQLQFLESSCRSYDQGHLEEAVRIAVSLRVLFHDSKTSTSILKHLGSKNILLLSTAEQFKKPELISLPLIRFDVNVDHFKERTFPCLEHTKRKEFVPFHVWWKKEKVIELNAGSDVYDRRKLILAAANKDGGAHVDAVLEPIYEKLIIGAGVSIVCELKYGLAPVTISFENFHFASLRQIAYEVLNSPDLKKLGDV